MKRFDFALVVVEEWTQACGVEALEGMGLGTLSPQNFSLKAVQRLVSCVPKKTITTSRVVYCSNSALNLSSFFEKLSKLSAMESSSSFMVYWIHVLTRKVGPTIPD